LDVELHHGSSEYEKYHTLHKEVSIPGRCLSYTRNIFNNDNNSLCIISIFLIFLKTVIVTSYLGSW